MSAETATYEEIARLALSLPPTEKIRLIERLAFRLRYDLEERPPAPRTSSRGALADLGPAPSAEDIDEARRDMWGQARGDGAG
jgi:hypothetical protein